MLLLITLIVTIQCQEQYKIINRIQRAPEYFTQGLFFDSPDTLIESTGIYGESRLQRINAMTGQPIQVTQLESRYFGEGCVMIDSFIYQFTWKEGECLVYNKNLELLFTRSIMPEIKEGWGVTTDGKYLYVSDGSSSIHVIEPVEWELIRTFNVHLQDGKKLNRINELQYVDDEIYANVFGTNYILRLNATTGLVIKVYDMSKLYAENELAYGSQCHDKMNDVLNGIAFNSYKGTFYLTGKRWHYIYEVILL